MMCHKSSSPLIADSVVVGCKLFSCSMVRSWGHSNSERIGSHAETAEVTKPVNLDVFAPATIGRGGHSVGEEADRKKSVGHKIVNQDLVKEGISMVPISVLITECVNWFPRVFWG